GRARVRRLGARGGGPAQLFRLARDTRHFVANAAHLVALEWEVVAAVAEPQLDHVAGVHDSVDAGQALGGAHVDRANPSVGVRAAQDLAHQHPRQTQVADVFGAAEHLVLPVQLALAGAYDPELAHRFNRNAVPG